MTLEDLKDGGRVLPMTRWGDSVMHARTRMVTVFDEELHTLVRDMFATMKASQGVGLAATQVGVDLAVFTYGCPTGTKSSAAARCATPLLPSLTTMSGVSTSRVKGACRCRVRSSRWVGPIIRCVFWHGSLR
jgi:hypothetical protein